MYSYSSSILRCHNVLEVTTTESNTPTTPRYALNSSSIVLLCFYIIIWGYFLRTKEKRPCFEKFLCTCGLSDREDLNHIRGPKWHNSTRLIREKSNSQTLFGLDLWRELVRCLLFQLDLLRHHIFRGLATLNQCQSLDLLCLRQRSTDDRTVVRRLHQRQLYFHSRLVLTGVLTSWSV